MDITVNLQIRTLSAFAIFLDAFCAFIGRSMSDSGTHHRFDMVCRYGLVGRNGRGKSCLLKWMAARREGCNSAAWRNSTIHYVTQEVEITPEMEQWTPCECVLLLFAHLLCVVIVMIMICIPHYHSQSLCTAPASSESPTQSTLLM